jgi:hypothetical protein
MHQTMFSTNQVSTLAATPTHVAITTRRRAGPVSTPA